MENEQSWSAFERTGKVSDYLEYTRKCQNRITDSVKEERGQREGKSDGNGVICRDHW